VQAASLIAHALRGNAVLTMLDLSKNNIGQSGGVAIAAMLAANNALVELDLAWNALRPVAAEAIAQALSANNTLQRLSLAWNGAPADQRWAAATPARPRVHCTSHVAHQNADDHLPAATPLRAGMNEEAGVAFGAALGANRSLELVDLAHCRLGDSAAASIACAIRANEQLRAVRLDGNQFTQLGARLLMAAFCESHTLPHLSLQAPHLSVRARNARARAPPGCRRGTTWT
jgi:Ran GTPase-activating protein (RanGAP) involved in mRNA processing and transport